jgi:hypothetical protein
LQKTGLPLHTQVIEEEKTYDLREEIVEKVIYESNPFTSDEIIRRAEEYAAQNTTHIYFSFVIFRIIMINDRMLNKVTISGIRNILDTIL